MRKPTWIAEQTGMRLVRTLLPVRRRDTHKGDYGRVLLLCGSEGLTGAARLAAKAALRTGSGLVYLGVPEKIYPIIAAGAGSEIVFPLPCDADGRLCLRALAPIQARMEQMDAVLLGPGLGRSAALTALVEQLVGLCRVPMVLDADGINAIAGHIDLLRGCACPIVLTPHDGEFARLSGRTLKELASGERAEIASEFAALHGCVLVLKGHRTLIALPDGTVCRNTTGTSALSKGGSGDVLTGLIGSLLCQGADAKSAALLGVWLHGRAGELLGEAVSAYCAAPEELITRGLPAAFRELTE